MPDFTFSVFRIANIGGTNGLERAGTVTIRDDDGNRDDILDDIEQAGPGETNGDQEVIASDFPELDVGDTFRARGIFRFTNNVTGETYDVREVFSNTAGNPVETLFILTSPLPDWVIDGTSRSFSLVNSDGTLPYADIVCFTSGTQIRLHNGQEAAIDDLMVGDRLMTHSGGAQPIRWIGSRVLNSYDLWTKPKHRPVRIGAGALGCDLPERDLIVSPQHRVLVRSRIAERIFGQEEVLIPAAKLLDLEGIQTAHDLTEVTYFHILFDAHQLIYSNGALTESLFTGPQAMKSIPRAAREEIKALFPEMFAPGFIPEPAGFVPIRGGAIRNLVARHRKNGKPLVSAS
ncbi:MAG: Hint domain-containing protein [Pseudomonadota bacterium]